MPFEVIEKTTASKLDPNKDYISSRQKPGKGMSEKDVLYLIQIGSRVFSRLKWSDGKDAIIFWGTGDDHGRLRIQQATGAAPGWNISAAKSTGVRSIRTSALPSNCAMAKFETVAMSFEVKEPSANANAAEPKALEVELPDGFLTDTGSAEAE